MDKSELQLNSDSLRSDVYELALDRPQPVLDQLARKVDISDEFKEAEAVINRVLEAAESNQTIERLLERKHEVKDMAATKDFQSPGAASLGEVLGNKEIPMPTSFPASSKNNYASSGGGLQKMLHDTSLYGYAIRYGFVSGLLALIIAIAVAVLFT
jgi:hypothetical protein